MLRMNYSTAKTIIQTFRREKRIAKRSKHMLESKKATKKNNFLIRFLSKRKVDSLIDMILREEQIISKKESIKEEHHVLEVATAPIIKTSNSPPRINTVDQVLLFADAEEGPRHGQVSRAVFVNREKEMKHDLFFVVSDIDPDAKYKKRIDYKDPLLLRHKKLNKQNDKLLINDNVENSQISIFNFSEYKRKILEATCKR